MHQGSPARVVVAGLLLAVLAAAAAWTVWSTRDTGGAVTSPSASAAADPEPPSPPVEPIEQPVGPATGDYAELATAAELEHPDTDPHIRRWYDWFGYFIGEEDVPSGEWTNKRQLWDALVSQARVEAMSLGAPFAQPLYDGDTGQPALLNSSYSTADTGLGELVEAAVTYRNQSGRVTMRYWPALIAVNSDGTGRVLAHLEPYELLVTDFGSYQELLEAAGDAAWKRVLEHRSDR
ncbi:MAG TPA: hypothetical protein VM287_14280 [Egibacteraceae bacterium]|nr:hypothetical protein [Egibacteraceae bacterium]